MRIDRSLLPLMCALALGCRRTTPIDAPRDRLATLDAGAPAPDVAAQDVPVDRPSRGLAAMLMSSSPATRTGPGSPWTISLRLEVRNQSANTLPLRREGFRVSVDEGVRGDLSAADAVEGPAEIPPRGRATVFVRASFPPSTDPPISVTFAFDSIGGANRPITFPIPSSPAPPLPARGESLLRDAGG